SCTAQGRKPVTSGTKAPAFKLSDFSGKVYTDKTFEGKVLFIDFWASWCPPCVASVPKVDELHRAYVDNPNVVVIGINLDTNTRQAERFINENEIPYIVLQGGNSSVGNDYGVRGIPTFLVINQSGVIEKRYTGFRPGYEQEWRTEIDRLLQ
ncbi:MAG: redoxin family protein, partial [Elusimicrobia bacterium]|nr:redoxin family protein [Elusimicrobiota bacterium]MBD3412314.1 redoxin family protein [Elusimicrobiota bacterium]